MFLKKSTRWRKAGYRIARILLALCMQLNCFRARRCCSISENWKAHAFLPRTRVLVPRSVSVFTAARIAPRYLKLLRTVVSLFPFKSHFVKSKRQSAENENSWETKGSLCEVQLIRVLVLSERACRSLASAAQIDTLALRFPPPPCFFFWITL